MSKIIELAEFGTWIQTKVGLFDLKSVIFFHTKPV